MKLPLLHPLIWLLLLGSLPFSARAAAPATDVPATVAAVAGYAPGQSTESLAAVEELVRAASADTLLKARLEVELMKLLAPSTSLEVKRFACRQLGVIGGVRALPALASLLQSDATAGLACLALGAYPPGQADGVLREALTGAGGVARLQIIHTLGDRRDAESSPALAPLGRSSDRGVAEAAIIALGKIADATAGEVLANLRREANPNLTQAVTEASLHFAGELAKAGNPQAASVYEELLASNPADHVRRAAFDGLLRLDRDGGEARILQTLRSDDPVLKPVAIAAIRDVPARSASARFGKELPGLPVSEQVWLIDSLAARHDGAARSAIAAALATSTDMSVRLAAAQALGQIGDASTVKPLAEALAVAKDDTEVNALVGALAALPDGPKTDKAMLAQVRARHGSARAHLIASLAMRRSPMILDALLAEAASPDAVVAKAAYRVLAKAITAETLPKLLYRFAAIRDTERREAVETFVEQAVLTVEDPVVRSREVRTRLARVSNTDVRVALLQLLPACGDNAALGALKDAWGDPDARIRAAAVAALAQWPTGSAWEPLAYICRNPENDTQRASALRGLARLFGEQAPATTDDRIVRHAQELLDGAQSESELKLILGALGSARHAGVLKLVLPLLGQANVRTEAEVAVKKIAEAIRPTDPEAANAALKQLAERR